MYVIRKEIVAESLNRLREQKTHALFAGYIYLQRRAAELERLTDLQPEFLPFFKQFFLSKVIRWVRRILNFLPNKNRVVKICG